MNVDINSEKLLNLSLKISAVENRTLFLTFFNSLELVPDTSAEAVFSNNSGSLGGSNNSGSRGNNWYFSIVKFVIYISAQKFLRK